MKKNIERVRFSGLDILNYLFLFVFALKLFSVLFGNQYDWDIDHEMYFGTRLLAGELLYDKEYHDKLPVVQFLFAVPAVFGSVRVWALLSIGICISAAFALRNILVMLLKEGTKLADTLLFSVASLGASFYLFLLSSLPGSLTHINPAAAGFSVLSLFFLLHYKYLRNPLIGYFLLVLAALCGSISISIRPYLAPSIVLFGIWISWRELAWVSISCSRLSRSDRIEKFLFSCKSILLFTLAWVFLLFLSGVVLNAMPYFFAGSLDSLLDGIRHNAQRLNPQSVEVLVAQQLRDIGAQGLTIVVASSFAVLFSALALAWQVFLVFFGSAQRSSVANFFYIDAILLGVVPLVLIELAIISRHYWSHYLQLFSPYLAIQLALGLSVVLHKWPVIYFRSKLAVIFFLVIVLLSSRGEILNAIRSLKYVYNPHPQAAILSDINMVISNRVSQGLPVSFLDASHMYSHWRNRESRHGFPHAANLWHISAGWWNGLVRPSKRLSDFPYKDSELCEMIDLRGPDLVFVDENSKFNSCFSPSSSIYQKLELQDLVAPGLIVYVRSS